MVQLSATRCNYIAILRVSVVSFAAITLCVTSQRVFFVVVVVVYFNLLSPETFGYTLVHTRAHTHTLLLTLAHTLHCCSYRI
jgi:hypothetical protein